MSNLQGTQDQGKKQDMLSLLRKKVMEDGIYTPEISDAISDQLMEFIKKHFESMKVQTSNTANR